MGYDEEVDEAEQQQNRIWVAGWRDTAAALERIKTDELRALTQEESGRVFAKTAFDTDTLWVSPERDSAAGLIEQQRLFMLSDEHPARHRRRL